MYFCAARLHQERAAQVHRHDRVPVVVGHLEQQVVAQDAGVVDQHDRRAELVGDPGHGGVDRRRGRRRRRRPRAPGRRSTVICLTVSAHAPSSGRRRRRRGRRPPAGRAVAAPMPRAAPVTMATRFIMHPPSSNGDSSRRASERLCTSSGPSARRSVRARRPQRRQREVLRDAGRAVRLDRLVQHPLGHRRRHDLDGLDLGVRALVADRVHQPGRLEHQQPGLLDAYPGLGDPLADHALLGQRPAERRRGPAPAGTSAPAPARPSRSGACSGGCGPGRAGPGRSRSRRPRRRSGSPPAPGRRRRRSRRGRRASRRCSRRRVIPRWTVTPGVSRGTRIMLCCRCRSARPGSVLPITMKIAQSRAHRAGRPPLAPVDHVRRRRRAAIRVAMLVASEEATSGSVMQNAERICAVQQRPQPALLLLRAAELGQQLHVAGVRRGAVERRRRQRRDCGR